MHSTQLLTLLSAFAGLCSAQNVNWTRIVVFGDSLSDNGNAYKASNGSFPRSPPNFQGRNSNGLVWNEHVATSLNITLTNYAYSGAVVDNLAGGANATSRFPGTSQQVEYYIGNQTQFGDTATTLFAYWAGGNDILYALGNRGVLNITSVTASIQRVLDRLLTATNARHLAVINLPTVDLLATYGGPYNTALNASLDALAAAHPNTRIYRVDVPTVYSSVRATSAANANATDESVNAGITGPLRITMFSFLTPCLVYTNISQLLDPNAGDVRYTVCDRPNQYFYWDFVHPTARIHCEAAKGFGKALGLADGSIACDGKPTSAALGASRTSSAGRGLSASVPMLFGMLALLLVLL